MSLLVLKLAVTIIAVVGLTLVAERLSTRAAGVLAGFPHGIAIVLWFIGTEQGGEFAAQAARFATAGLGANVMLAWSYGEIARRAGRGPMAVVGAALGSVGVFLALAAGLNGLSPGPVLAVVLAVALIGLARLLVGLWPPAAAFEKPRFRLGEQVARAALAGAIVVAVTGLAALIGPQWAGLLAGFPVVSFPFFLILHLRHGPDPVVAVVRHYPFGIMALVVYTLIVAPGFGLLGVTGGTLAGLAGAVIWLAGAQWAQARRGAQARR